LHLRYPLSSEGTFGYGKYLGESDQELAISAVYVNGRGKKGRGKLRAADAANTEKGHFSLSVLPCFRWGYPVGRGRHCREVENGDPPQARSNR
jgi:hypothetical protein